MKSYRPLFGTIFIGLVAMLIGGAALLSAFGHNIFFSATFSLAWIVVGLLVVSAILLLAAAFWPRREKEEAASLFDSRGAAPATVRSTQAFARTASYGTPVTAIERRFVPVTDDDARKGASSNGGNVLADLRWLEPNGEQVSVPLYATQGGIDLLVNAESSVAIHLAMGTGTVTVDPTLGLHLVGGEPLTGAVPGGQQVRLGRQVLEAGEARLIVNVESPAADLRISAI